MSSAVDWSVTGEALFGSAIFVDGDWRVSFEKDALFCSSVPLRGTDEERGLVVVVGLLLVATLVSEVGIEVGRLDEVAVEAGVDALPDSL